MRIGVVGTSQWTGNVHGKAAAASPDWELTTVYGRSAEKAAATAEALGCRATTDYDELLSAVDAVAFAVPPDVQAPLALRAADAGKHLLLEKPLALDRAQGAELVAAVERAGVASLVFFTVLWVGTAAAWLDERRDQSGWESGRFEQLVHLDSAFLAASPWRAEHGALWDVGPHALSALERVLGPVTSAMGLQGVRDHVHLTFRHAGGATSTAELTLTAPEGVRRVGFRFLGPDGEAVPDQTVMTFSPDVAAGAALVELADQARTGRRGGPDAAYGLHVVDVLAAAQRSLASGAAEQV